MLKNLKLTKVEKKSIRIGGAKRRHSGGPLKAFEKLFSEKEARMEIVEQAVGWIWCPMKGTNARN